MTKLPVLFINLCIGLLLSLSSYLSVSAQSSPERINYQAVARDGNGDELQGVSLDVEFSILEGSATSDPVYEEIHTGVITDSFGLFSLQIGNGVVMQGDFSAINWSENTYVRVGIDAGNGIVDLGTMQLVSVPYALFATKADSANYGADADADPENEMQELQLNGNELSLSDDASATLVDLSEYNTDSQQLSIVNSDNQSATIGLENAADISFSIEDADADSLNELQELQIDGSELSLSNDNSGTTVDLSTFNTDSQQISVISSDQQNVNLGLDNATGISFSIEDADSDPINEIQTISKSGNTVSLTDGGSFTDEVDDADADPSNEIQTISKSGSTVSLTDGGSFTDEVDDADADPGNEIQTISKSGSIVTLSNGGGNFTDAVNDADANSANELITSVGFNTSSNILTITESGADQSADLSELKNDLNWDQNGQNISNNNTGNVGINEANPSSTLQIMGSMAAKVRVEGPSGSSYALGDETIFIGTPDIGDVEVDLPLAASVPGRIYIIKKGNPSTFNDLKIHSAGSDNIEGLSTYILGDVSGVYEQVIIVSDGISDWWIISKD